MWLILQCNCIFTVHVTYAYSTLFRESYSVRRPCNVYRVPTCYSALQIVVLLPARRYASAGYRDRNVSVCLSVRPSVRPSRAGIVSKRRKLAA